MRENLSPVTAMNDACRKGWVKWGLFLASLLLFTTAGCAGKSPDLLSPRHMEAIRHNQGGIKAEARGEYPRALEEFSEALRINSSIENSEGIIVALVNSSRVHRRSGDAKAALAAINEAVPRVATTDPLYSEVSFEMAQVQLLSGDLNASAEWAFNAAAADTGSRRGMRINLLARILYLKGNLAEAETKAREALLLSRENDLSGEEANSLRTLGDIHAAGKRHVEAAECYNQALAIDKTVGKSRKIAADLRAIAALALLQGDTAKALGFYRRAFAVNSSGGDLSGAAEDLLNMSRVHGKRGEKELSERLLAERDNILRSLSTP